MSFFNWARRALEQAETEARKQTLLKPLGPRGLNSPSKSPQKGYRVAKPTHQLGQVDLPHIMKVFNQVSSWQQKYMWIQYLYNSNTSFFADSPIFEYFFIPAKMLVL